MGIEAPVGAPHGAPAAAERELAAGEILVREGDVGDDVVRGRQRALEIAPGAGRDTHRRRRSGRDVGEIAALAGCRATATVRAIEPRVVRPLGRASIERWLDEDAASVAALAVRRQAAHRPAPADRRSSPSCSASTARWRPRSSSRRSWVRLEAGDVLFVEGDAVRCRRTCVVSGRLDVLAERRARRRDRPRRDRRRDRADRARAPHRRPSPPCATATLCPLRRRGVPDARPTAHPALMLQLSRTMLARLGRRERVRRPGPLDRRRGHRAGRHPAVRHPPRPTRSPGTARRATCGRRASTPPSGRPGSSSPGSPSPSRRCPSSSRTPRPTHDYLRAGDRPPT